MRTASIHPEGLFEWDQNDKTRKNEMRVGDYIFVAIFDDEQLVDSRKFMTNTFTTPDELSTAIMQWTKDMHVERIVMPDDTAG